MLYTYNNEDTCDSNYAIIKDQVMKETMQFPSYKEFESLTKEKLGQLAVAMGIKVAKYNSKAKPISKIVLGNVSFAITCKALFKVYGPEI